MNETEYPCLPKWPCMYVTGKSVTPDQAKDIIFRTDSALEYPTEYFGGNDRAFNKKFMKRAGWDKLLALEKPLHDVQKNTTVQVDLWRLYKMYGDLIGHVRTEYIRNSFLSTSYIGGPHGWCNIDGTILWEGHNIGKWPSVEVIRDEWKLLAETFPYLDLVCTLFDRENCEPGMIPLVTFTVKNGNVQVLNPDLNLHDRAPQIERTDEQNEAFVLAIMNGDYRRERGWPEEWVNEFCERSDRIIGQIYGQL